MFTLSKGLSKLSHYLCNIKMIYRQRFLFAAIHFAGWQDSFFESSALGAGGSGPSKMVQSLEPTHPTFT
jgi:hypothetical protein